MSVKQSVGLLVCDHVHEDFVHRHGDYVSMFRKLLPDLILTPYFVCDNQYPAHVTDHSAYICSGSKASVYDQEGWIFNLKSFVKSIYEHQLKFVGVCFGHQMIAEALGGKVQKAEVGWSIGVHQFTLKHTHKWMIPEKEHINLLMLCQDQVIELPENSTVLASANDCLIGLFQVGENFIGIQAHPEFSKAYNQAIYEQRAQKIGSEKVENANESLQQSIDNGLFAQWIIRFIRHDLTSF